jgi:hypothetical protein
MVAVNPVFTFIEYGDAKFLLRMDRADDEWQALIVKHPDVKAGGATVDDCIKAASEQLALALWDEMRAEMDA